jgi:hypothetical protein
VRWASFDRAYGAGLIEVLTQTLEVWAWHGLESRPAATKRALRVASDRAARALEPVLPAPLG